MIQENTPTNLASLILAQQVVVSVAYLQEVVGCQKKAVVFLAHLEIAVGHLSHHFETSRQLILVAVLCQ